MGFASLNPSYAFCARTSPADPGTLSKIRLLRLGDRIKALIEVIEIVLGADRLPHRSVHLEPALLHGERRVERIGVFHRHKRSEIFSVRIDSKALHDVQ